MAAVVRPGDVVLDLGSGTGILGYLAVQAGAARVYAVDGGAIVGLARDVIRANDLAGKIQVIRTLSTWAAPPEPVDVVITDQIGRIGFDAGIVEFMADARARWLKPGGRTVPQRITVHAAPYEHAEVREAVEFWTTPVAGIDFSPIRPLAASTGYPFHVAPEDRLADGAPLITFDLATATAGHWEGQTRFTVTRDGAFDAVVGWFVADLAPGVTMTNAPGHPEAIARRQAVLPVDQRTAVRTGDEISLTMRIRPTEHLIQWKGEVCGLDGAVRARFKHSTFEGMLISHEDLLTTHPDRVPSLTPAGMARRTVLELCDGGHTVSQIEAEVQVRHAGLLPTRAAASAFVAEVLTRYAG